MYKLTKIVTIALSLVASLALTGHVYAANLSVRLEQPKTPTNQNDFPVHFVTLDTLGRTVTVRCYKQAPGEGLFTQYGADQVFADGGNSGICTPGSGVVNTNGTYAFKVTASAGADHSEDSVNVDYNTSGPGDVRDYNKTHTNSCEYTIHFKTAADAGKTVKVELYRSDAVPFNADSGSRIQTIVMGSDEAKDTTNTVPDCSKTYYYAVRAFDASGNGSALIGDNVTTTTVINPTGSPAQGAIPVSGNAGTGAGSVLGQASVAGSMGATGSAGGDTLGDTTPSAEIATPPKTEAKSSMAKKLAIGGAILVVGVLLYAFWKKNQRPTV